MGTDGLPCLVTESRRGTREEERGMISFSSRRKAIERVGLPEVRQIVPELRPLLMMRIIKECA